MYKIENLSCITRTGLEAIFYSQHARKKKVEELNNVYKFG